MPDLPQLNRTALEFVTFVAEHESISRSDKAKRLEVRDQECVNLGIAHERRRLRELSIPEFAVVQTALSTGQHSAAKDAARPALERIAKLFEVPERQSVPFFDASPMRTDESKISRELAEQMLPPIDAVVRQPFKQLLLSELEYEDLGQVLQFALFHSTPNSKLTGHAHRLKQALENGAVSDNRVREQTAPPMVEVLFVLNGENATAQVNPGDSVGKARDLALAKSDWSRAPQDWEMRDAGGHTVSPLIDARECPPLVYLSLREGLGQVLPADALTSQQLISILSNHCGESFNGEPGTSEGAVETLTRIIRQRDELRPDPTAARVYIRCDDVALLLAYSVYPIGNPRLEDATKRIRMALARPGTHQIQVDIVDNPSVASKPASGNPWWSGSLPPLHDFSPESNAAFSHVYAKHPSLLAAIDSQVRGGYSAIDVRTAFECGWREESSRKTEPAVYWANKAKELWQILDNIDTLGDSIKPRHAQGFGSENDSWSRYFKAVDNHANKRHFVLRGDLLDQIPTTVEPAPLVEEAEQPKPAYPRRPRHRVTDLREAVAAALRPGGAYAERDPRDSESRERTALRHALRFLLKLDERVSRFEHDAELGAKCNPEDRAWAEQRGSGVVKDD